MAWWDRFRSSRHEANAYGGDDAEASPDPDPARGRSFPVSGAIAATSPLPEVPYKTAVEALLQPGLSKRERTLFQNLASRPAPGGGPRVGETRSPDLTVEACSRYHSRLLADIVYHPVFAAVHEAFDGHYPLHLSPDMIWLMVVQGVANHINANAEELRQRFVRHAGRLDIQIRRDDFFKGSPENPWAEVFAQFADAVAAHVGPSRDLFRCEFSTTGPVERAALDLAWLDAMQSYFQLSVRSRCGIPEITLEGTPDDWRAIRERVEGFAGIGLDWWWDALRPILGQFEAASRGEADRGFWNSIYLLHGESGGPYITGWIAAFFPYLRDHETGLATRRNNYLLALQEAPDFAARILYPKVEPEGRGYGAAYRGRLSDASRRSFVAGDATAESEGGGRLPFAWEWGWTTESLPSGLSRAPFRWIHESDYFPMELLGGFVGVSQCPDSLGLRPEIGWAVRQSASAS